MRKKIIIFLILATLLVIGLTAWKVLTRDDHNLTTYVIETKSLDIHYKNPTLMIINPEHNKLSIDLKNKSEASFLSNFYINGEILRPKDSCKYFFIELIRKNVNNVGELVNYISCANSLDQEKTKLN